ncbi:10620_t:CDS:1, partial [Racocetra persica]
NNWEQPLLILACLLHPKYRMTYFKDKLKINYLKLDEYLKYYYKTWLEDDSKCILCKFADFSTGEYPFDEKTYDHFGDIWKYWNYAKDSTLN